MRRLKLPELLARADLADTEINIVSATITSWIVKEHSPTAEELKLLHSILSNHGSITLDVEDGTLAYGVGAFNQTREKLVAEYTERVGKRAVSGT